MNQKEIETNIPNLGNSLSSTTSSMENASVIVEVPHDCDSSLFHPFGRPEHFEEDHSWSVLSNSVFLFAGVSYLCLSIWDVFFYPDSVEDDSVSPLDGKQQIAYSTIIACGVLGYFVDSIIDVIWAKRIRNRTKARKKRMKINDISLKDNDKPKKKRRFRPQKFKKKVLEQLNKVRKHAAHRRDYYAALFFGAASTSALLDWIYDCFKRESRPPLNFLSVHFYLLSAIFALTGTRSRPISFTLSIYDPDFLEDMGDIFFLIGSLVDTMLCDFHFDDEVVKWELVSAFLWALDASLYLRSDAVVRMELNKERWLNELYNEAIESGLHSGCIDTEDECSYYEMSDLEASS